MSSLFDWLHTGWSYMLQFFVFGLECIGICIIFGGIIVGIIRAVYQYFCHEEIKNIYKQIRKEIAHAILLGLEILIAVDIIKSIDTNLNIDDALVLGLIVIIRTILSFSLEYEIHGKFPGQKTLPKTEKI